MSETKTVTSTEYQNAVGEYGEAARKGPVIVTRHKRPWFVVIDPDEYERLMRYDTRQSIHPSKLSNDLKLELRKKKLGSRDKPLDHLME